MIIGIPTEIKAQEYRISMIPSSVKELTGRGHRVLVQSGAGEGSNYTDELYSAVGAEIVASADEVFEQCELIVKVKEPQASELSMIT